MNEFETNSGNGRETEAAGRRLKREGQAASDLAGDLGKKAGQAMDAAGTEASKAVERIQGQASDHLSALADSVRRASDDYRSAQPGLLADMMEQAADGLESVARSVGSRSPSEMLGAARDFGRRNPVGLLLVGAAAGFALSRLATGAAAAASREAGTTAKRPQQSNGMYGSQDGGYGDGVHARANEGGNRDGI